MPTYDLIYPHRQRTRTRSTALLLALSAFAVTKLLALEAIDLRAAHDLEGTPMVEGLQILDLECGDEQAVHC